MTNLLEKYSRQKFLKFLRSFLPEDFSEEIAESEFEHGNQSRLINKIYCLGEVESLGSIKILEIEHNSINDPKVSLTLAASRVMDNFMIDYALVIFFCKDNSQYRFSFINTEYEWISNYKANKKYSNPKRYSFLLGENTKSHTPFIQLIKEGRVKNLDDLRKRFSTEVITDEFFESYLSLYIKLQKYMLNDSGFREFSNNHNIDIAYFAKLVLSRIMFCYFLQKRNLLASKDSNNVFKSDQEFMRSNFIEVIKNNKNYYNDFLEYLFYNHFSNPNCNLEGFHESNNYIAPYIGGTLFDPIENYDWKEEFLTIPNSFFSNSEGSGVLDIFDRYNITVDESDHDSDMSIDPEMLGKIYEKLLPVNVRNVNAAHYTPRMEVAYMCEQSIYNYFKNNLAISDDHNLLLQDIIFAPNIVFNKLYNEENNKFDQLAEKLSNLILGAGKDAKTIKILDPAVGSGEFSISMINLIVKILTRLDPKRHTDKYKLKKKILSNMIYGTDIDASAIQISKLRAWLCLVVDLKNTSEIEALPNLEFKFVCANSIKELQELNQLSIFSDDNLKTKLSDIRSKWFRATKRKNDLKEKYFSIINQNDIFDDERVQQLKGYNPFIPSSVSSFYDPEFHHGVTRFDLIVANPPYNLESKNKKELFRPLNSSRYYQARMNMWYFFACHSIDWVKENGIISFIAMNNWNTNDSASLLREKILSETTIIDYVDFGNHHVFKAAVNTMMMTLLKSNKKPSYNLTYRKLDNAENISLFEINNGNIQCIPPNKKSIDRLSLKGEYITFSDQDTDIILDYISNQSNYNLSEGDLTKGIETAPSAVNKKLLPKLSEGHKIGEGVFTLSNQEVEALNLTKKEMTLIKPFYGTHELVDKYFCNKNNNEFLIYTNSSFSKSDSLDEYPNIKKHLDKYQSIITSAFKPYGINRARKPSFFEDEKIISIRKCFRPTFSYIDYESYFSANYYIIKPTDINLRYLTAIFNSKLAAFWLHVRGKKNGNMFQVDKKPLMSVPIKLSKDTKKLEVLVNDIQIYSDNKKDITSLQDEIDREIYKIYEVNDNMINYIEDYIQKYIKYS